MGYFYGVLIKELNIAPLIRALPVIPIEPGNTHITITYIGDKPPSQEADNRVGTIAASTPCFTIRLGQLTLLPSPAKPRVLAIEVMNNEQLSRLRTAIISTLRDSGIAISDRFLGDFKPHITIAYIKTKKVDPHALLENARELGIEKELTGKTLLIDTISLVLARENNYKEISRHELKC